MLAGQSGREDRILIGTTGGSGKLSAPMPVTQVYRSRRAERQKHKQEVHITAFFMNLLYVQSYSIARFPRPVNRAIAHG